MYTHSIDVCTYMYTCSRVYRGSFCFLPFSFFLSPVALVIALFLRMKCVSELIHVELWINIITIGRNSGVTLSATGSPPVSELCINISAVKHVGV